MKASSLFSLLGIALSLSACSMYKETYFGTKYPPTDTVQTFYAAKDVNQPYKVIGHMNVPISRIESVQQKARLNLIKRAKQVGANGLIFSEIHRETNEEAGDKLSIKAEAIVFTSEDSKPQP